MQNPFAALNAMVKREKPPERRVLRHGQEREIIESALSTLALSDHGQQLLDFVHKNEIKIGILKGRETRDYAATEKTVYISVADHMYFDDPDITIHLVGALREAMQEYDPALKRPDINKGEQLFIHRMTEKLEDKLFYQTVIVYELGNLANKTEFIDSFATMGYYSLIEGYEKDLIENS